MNQFDKVNEVIQLKSNPMGYAKLYDCFNSSYLFSIARNQFGESLSLKLFKIDFFDAPIKWYFVIQDGIIQTCKNNLKNQSERKWIKAR